MIREACAAVFCAVVIGCPAALANGTCLWMIRSGRRS